MCSLIRVLLGKRCEFYYTAPGILDPKDDASWGGIFVRLLYFHTKARIDIASKSV